MAKDISDNTWSENEEENNSASPDGLQGGYAPSTISPTVRGTRAGIKRSWNRINASTTSTGTATASVLTYSMGPAVYKKGERFAFWANATNTGAMTLNINALGAKSILRSNGSALIAGDITANCFTELVYDGTAFRLVLSIVGNGSALTNLNASNLATGTVDDVRLPETMTGKTFSSKVTVNTDGSAIVIKSTGTGAAATGFVDFQDSTGTRQGWVGLGTSSQPDTYLYSEVGSVRLQGTSILANGYAVWDAGNFNPATKANLTGGTFTGSVGVSSSATAGEIRLVTGTATAPGYIEFRNADGTRAGYIGSQSGTTLRMMTENGITGWTMTGALTATGDITAFSDARLKSNVETISGALEMVENMRGVRYDMNGKRNIGVIAQEFQQVTPELVLTADDEIGTLSVNYGNTVGVLIEAIKELKAQVDELKAGSEVR